MKYNNYTITMSSEEGLVLDVGDLEGIVMQLDAISQGMGMDFTVVEYEGIENTWKWNAIKGEFK